MNDVVYFWHADKLQTPSQSDPITLGMCNQAFLAEQNKNFLQVDSITLGVDSQICPKKPKQKVCNIFGINM